MTDACDTELEGICAYSGVTGYPSGTSLTLYLQRSGGDIIAYLDSVYKKPIDRILVKLDGAPRAELTLQRADAALTVEAAAHVRLEGWNAGNGASVKRIGDPAGPYTLFFTPPLIRGGDVTWNFSEVPPSLKLTVKVKRLS